MIALRKTLLSIGLALSVAAPLAATTSGPAIAATKAEINRDADEALQTLYRSNPAAEALAKTAKAVLIFPEIVKGGFIFGGAYGEGVLKQGLATVNYYNSVSASWGLQVGAQTYGYAVFLMTDKALEFLDKTAGWELGVGPTIVVVNEGIAKNLSTTTAKDDAYAFIFDQTGLMAGVSIEGTKVTKFNPND